MRGYPRADGRKGIRDIAAVVYLVECARHVADAIARPFADEDVHVIGFAGCYPNAYAERMLTALCTHPNVGGVVLVSLGCESFDRRTLAAAIAASGRPVQTVVIQEVGGTGPAVTAGRAALADVRAVMAAVKPVAMDVSELVIGTVCGGSDGTSGVTANPAIGRAFDRLIARGATCLFEETGELIGCEHIMADRAETPEVAEQLVAAVAKAARYYTLMGHGSFAPGNAEGGLTTLEEKSMGAYAKSGASRIRSVVKPADPVAGGGLHLLDVVPDGDPMFGFPNINDNAEIAELIACGSHIVLFSTGRGSVVGSAVAPVIKVCANPDTYARMSGDMDVDAGRILTAKATLDDVGDEIVALIEAVGNGGKTVSEALGHREFIIGYKRFSENRRACG
jgi:altronate hydrolase